MVSLESHNIDKPHESRPYKAHGHMDVVTLGDFTLGKGTSNPAGGDRKTSSRWPAPGHATSTHRHLHLGHYDRADDDGTEAAVRPGDVMLIEPGHDAWVVGDEPCILYDTGIAAYAKPA